MTPDAVVQTFTVESRPQGSGEIVRINCLGCNSIFSPSSGKLLAELRQFQMEHFDCSAEILLNATRKVVNSS